MAVQHFIKYYCYRQKKKTARRIFNLLTPGKSQKNGDGLSTNKGTMHMWISSRIIEEQDNIQSADSAAII